MFIYIMNNVQMSYYNRIYLSEGIDIDICYYWYFLDKGFTFRPNVCIGGHDALIMSLNRNDVATLNINGADYSCIITGISKNYENVKINFNVWWYWSWKTYILSLQKSYFLEDIDIKTY